ncbi:hypothetical protein B0H12DRAFT_1329963 [Mycena haematopus]|nr:hypothetical protein B0H12DRAFT_1329963 [Mycena haematopus]
MIAIALVVDSSAALASEWPLLLTGYIMHMLRRLGESNPPGMKFRVAFITYGTQDTPLISKNFFHDLVALMPAFRDDPSKLGIGQTSCGGDTGMAALEGFVAALELFDILRQSAQARASPFPPVYHIFHVAAGMPDSAERPQCNQSPILDSVTWESLPSEMKKRNIHLSSISVRSKLPKFSELHSTSSLVPPWFAVRPQHTVLLAGYPTVLAQKGGPKRPGEAMTTTPDPKRAKIAPPNTNASPQNTHASPARVQTPATVPTPTPAPMRIPTPSAAPPPTNPVLPQVPVPPPATAPIPAPGPVAITPERIQVIQNALRSAEQAVRAVHHAMTEARAKGDTQLVERLMPQWTEKNQAYLKFKANIQAMLTQHTQRAAYAHAQQAMAAQQGQAAQAAQASAQQAHAMQPGQQLGQQAQAQQAQAQQAQQAQLAQAQAQQAQVQQAQGAAQGRPLSQGQGQPSQMPQNAPMKQDDAPMDFGDNDHDMKPPLPSNNADLPVPVQGHMRSLSGGGRPMIPMNPGAMGASPMITQQMQKMIEQKERARQSSAQIKQNSVAVWQGVMSWSGSNPAGAPREVSSYVIASSMNRDACHAETWPTKLTLKLTETPAVPLPVLQVWMKRTEPAVCTFKANPTAEVPVHNEMAYKALVALLLKQKLYFVGSWTLPNGKLSSNLLIFPVQTAGLVGAFFPLNGIPDMPALPNNPGSIIPNPTPPIPAPAAAQGLGLGGQLPPQLAATGTAGPQLMAAIDTYMKQRGVGISQALIAQLAKLSPPERNQMMASIIRTGMEQRRQRIVAAAAAGGGPSGLGGAIPAGLPQMGMMPQMGQQQQQQQPDMGGGFNHGQFGLAGGGGGGAGMDGGMGGGMGGMGAGSTGMYADVMAGAGLPRTVSNGSSGGGGAVSYQMMQSFMARSQDNAGN